VILHEHSDECACFPCEGAQADYPCPNCKHRVMIGVGPDTPLDLLYCACGFPVRMESDLRG
jgi:hypothetical protein